MSELYNAHMNVYSKSYNGAKTFGDLWLCRCIWIMMLEHATLCCESKMNCEMLMISSMYVYRTVWAQ